MTLSLERKIVLGFAAALLVLLLVTAAAWWNVVRFGQTHYWVEHTREVLSKLEQATSDVLSMQGSSRGFVLTGSDEVLDPFNESRMRLGECLADLRRMVEDNMEQTDRISRLEPLAAKAQQLMLDRVADRRSRGLEVTRESSAYLEGQRAVKEFREVVDEMIKDERELLDDRLVRATKVGRLTVFTIVSASALATGLIILAASFVRRDLRRRQETEVALQESFARVEDLYNQAPCGYHSLDAKGDFLAINDTALQWLGYSREEVVGKINFKEILGPASADRFSERFEFFKRKGNVANVEYDWRRKDGTIFPVLLNATAVYDASGKYTASRATVFDATERKRVEAERDRFFTLSRDLLCIAGSDGFFKRINPSWEQTLGHSADELMSRPFSEFIHDEDLAATQSRMAELARGREIIGFENRFRCKDGSYRWLRWNARSSLAEQLIFASAHDVTAQRADAERIQGLNDDLATRAVQLEAANRELESFSYSVSHDLRAPLRHIDGFSSLLTKRAQDLLDAEGRRYIAVISRSAKQMGTLIDDLLAFSRIGRIPLNRAPVRHGRLVDEVISNGRYDSESRTIAWEIGPLPDVAADEAMLRQVWANLIDNAVKYSGKQPAPRVVIGSRIDATTGELIFFVRDNGVGFNMEYADKLFGVFQRLHSPSDFEGTGIGLANVRRIVTRHGGRTWAESRNGDGATFYFSLPLPPASAEVSS